MKESINDLYKLANLQTEINPEIECQFDYNNLLGKIEFNNVSFCYPINPSYQVLKNIKLTIEPGEKIASQEVEKVLLPNLLKDFMMFQMEKYLLME